jgi:adenosylcobinamide-phosphate synthase
VGLLLGYVADRVVGDPRRGHPVAGFGTVAAGLERRVWRDSRGAGAGYVAVLVGGAAAAGLLAERRRSGAVHTLLTAAAAWAVLGGRSLDREVAAVDALLDAGRLDDARRRLTHLVGRDTTGLSESEVVRAAIESLAENTSDAVVGSLCWGAVAGVPGLLAHRAANTLDAMVGHRSARHLRFGWAAARTDDVLNLPGSRVTAALTVLLGPRPRAARRAWRRDAGAHPSPNAGPVEAAYAGALGIRLGGTNTYGDRVEHRARLGDGPAPTRADLARARRLARRVDLGALVLAIVTSEIVANRRATRRSLL